MSDDDDLWNQVDAEQVLAGAPLKLTQKHIAALRLKFGEEAANQRIATNVRHALRNVQIIPPNRGPRR